jgi:hypothetical protein
MPGPSAYNPPPVPNPSAYDHRHSYYQDAPPNYAYDRPQEQYYRQPSYASAPQSIYDNGYSDNIRFQPNYGVDQNSFNRKRRGNLPKEATNMMKQWFQDHRVSPYPTEEQKVEMCAITGLNISQVRWSPLF